MDESLRLMRSKRRSPWQLIALAAFLILSLFLAFLYTQLMGLGGWEPDEHSEYAARARTVNSELHDGMTRTQVRRVFHDDIVAFPKDSVEDSSGAYWGEGIRRWAIETDFSVFEPRKHFWNSFDTMWTVRTRFKQDNGVLIEHSLRAFVCCGP